MALVPVGKSRVMVAQNFFNPLSEGFEGQSIADENSSRLLETDNAMEENISGINKDNIDVNNDVNIQQGEDQNLISKEKGRKTLTTYIYEKLQSYGYPGRRLQEFKVEFVKEFISPEGVKDIKVIIPDKKYQDEKGFTDTIEYEELKDISNEINKTFGLNFNGAERSDGKWTIKFTSADLSAPEEEMTHDNLDQVYGKPDKSKTEQQRPAKVALTIREMIKEQKNKVAINLNKIIGD